MLKPECRSHHQVERADGSRAGSGAQGIAVRWPDICGTWLQTLSTGSHDHEVTPHGSIRPLLFDDVLVVRARKTENEKDKKQNKKDRVFFKKNCECVRHKNNKNKKGNRLLIAKIKR